PASSSLSLHSFPTRRSSDLKRKLHYLNMRDKKYNNNVGAIKHDWVQADVITINYESLQSKLNIINDLLDSKTMLVFDEVHRVKGVGGQRAKAALSLSQTPQIGRASCRERV